MQKFRDANSLGILILIKIYIDPIFTFSPNSMRVRFSTSQRKEIGTPEKITVMIVTSSQRNHLETLDTKYYPSFDYLDQNAIFTMLVRGFSIGKPKLFKISFSMTNSRDILRFVLSRCSLTGV